MLSALMPQTLGAYVALRAATGFAIGGNLPLAVTVTSELVPLRHRDRALVGLHLFYEAGALLSTTAARILLPASGAPGTRVEWRTYLSLVSLPSAVVVLLALFRLPESPVWLASKGHRDRAQRVLAHILRRGRGQCCGGGRAGAPLPLEWPSSSSAPSGSAEETAAGSTGDVACSSTSDNDLPHAPSRRRGVPFSLLFRRRTARTTLLVMMLWFSADTASAWWSWLPSVASVQGVPAPLMYTAVITGRVAASSAFLIAAVAISCCAANKLLIGCLLACCALSAALSVWVDSPPLFSSPSFIAIYASFAVFFGGLWSLMYVVTPSCFEPSLRGSGFGLASALGKLGQLTSPLIVGALADRSIPAMGVFLTSAWALAALSLLLLARLAPSLPATLAEGTPSSPPEPADAPTKSAPVPLPTRFPSAEDAKDEEHQESHAVERSGDRAGSPPSSTPSSLTGAGAGID
jgi:putative MFS transporter